MQEELFIDFQKYIEKAIKEGNIIPAGKEELQPSLLLEELQKAIQKAKQYRITKEVSKA